MSDHPEVPKKRLTRSVDDKWIGGVCGGIGDYTGVDANLIRLGVVLFTVLGVGTTGLVYLVGWFLMPEE